MTHRALIVAAVSKPGQAAEEKASIPDQLSTCRQACQQRQWEIVQEIIIPGHSRNYDDLLEIVTDCSEYGDIIRTISSGKISLFVCLAYDRLWRTDALRAQVTAICRRHAVQVYSLKQAVEPLAQEEYRLNGNESARWMEIVGGMFAESENTARVRRSRTGREGVIKRGLVQCTTPAYGYIKVGIDKIEPDPIKAPWVLLIFTWRVNERLGYRSIARRLTTQGAPPPVLGTYGWNHSNVSHIIHNSVYKGSVRWGTAFCEQGQHSPLVSAEMWERAQMVPVIRTHNPRQQPLVGLCRCRFCGANMIYDGGNGLRPLSLRCSGYLNKGKSFCVSNYHNASKVEDFVLHQVAGIFADRQAYIVSRVNVSDNSIINQDIARIETELKRQRERELRWKVAYDRGYSDVDEFGAVRKEVAEQIYRLEQEHTRLSLCIVKPEDLNARLDAVSTLGERLYELDYTELQVVYRHLIDYVTLERGHQPVMALL